MQWQDTVLTIGQVVFSFALIPTIFNKQKPALSSSLISGVFLMVYAIVFATLSLWFTVIPTILTGTCWFILAYQRYRNDKKKKS